MKVKFENGEYKFVGEFNYGFGGIFKNNENGEGNIKIVVEEEDFAELNVDHSNPNKVIIKLEKFINKMQKRVKKYNGRLKNAYLLDLFNNLIYCEKPFWEKFNTIPNYNNFKEEADKQIFNSLEKNSDFLDKLLSLYDIQYEESKLTSILIKSNIEKSFRKVFKFLDFDLLLKSIEPDSLIIDATSFSVILKNPIVDAFAEYSARYDKKLERDYWRHD